MKSVQAIVSVLLIAVVAVSPPAKWPWAHVARIQDGLLAVALLCGWLAVLWRTAKRQLPAPVPVPAIVLMCAAVMSVVHAVDVGSALREAAQTVMLGSVFIVTVVCFRERRWIRTLCGVVALACAVTLIMAVNQLCEYGTAPWGTFKNRNLFTGFIAGASIISAVWLQAVAAGKGRLASAVLFGLAFITLPAAAWLCIGTGIALLCVLRQTRKLGACAAVGAATGALLSPLLFQVHFAQQVRGLAWLDPNGSDVAQRYLEWFAALDMMRHHPVLGVGAGNYQACIGGHFGLLPKLNTLETDAQNGWLVTGSTMGMAALAMVAWMFWDGIRAGLRNPDGRDRNGLFAGLAVAGTVWAIANLFTPVMVRESGPLVMIVLGLLWQKREAEPTAAHGTATGTPARIAYGLCPAQIVVMLGIVMAAIGGIHRTVEHPVCITIEAEDMRNIVPPVMIAEDRIASGFKALKIPTGAGQGFWKQAGGSAESFVDLPQEDSYYVWMRTKWSGSCENAIYVQIDDGRRIVAGNDAIFHVWHWVATGPYELAPGRHLLRLSNHSHGIMVDKIEIVNDPLYRPAGYGQEVSAFFDGFGGCDGQDSGSWTTVSGLWSVIGDSAGNVRATSSTFAQVGLGTGLAVAHQIKWRDCDIEAYVMSAGTGIVGTVFGFVDRDNYTLVEWANRLSAGTNALRLFSVCDGKRRLLARGGTGYRNGAWHVMGVRRIGDRLGISVDKTEVFSVNHPDLTEGHIGLYTRNNDCTYFDNIKVVALVNGKPVHEADTVADTVESRVVQNLDDHPFVVESVRIGAMRIPALLIYEKSRIGGFGPAIIELPGWGGSKSTKQRRLSPRPALRGYVEVHVDLRAHGDRRDPDLDRRCAENFPRTSMAVLRGTAKDIHKVIDYLEKRKDLGVTRIGVAGYSMGGAVALLSMSIDRRVDAAASINGPGCDYLASAANTTYAALQGWNTNVAELVDDELRAHYAEYDPLLHTDRFLDRPVMFLGNRHDRIAEPTGVIKLFARLKEIYGPHADRLELALCDPPASAAGREDPMLSHMPDIEKLPLVDAFLDKHLVRKSGKETE